MHLNRILEPKMIWAVMAIGYLIAVGVWIGRPAATQHAQAATLEARVDGGEAGNFASLAVTLGFGPSMLAVSGADGTDMQGLSSALAPAGADCMTYLARRDACASARQSLTDVESALALRGPAPELITQHTARTAALQTATADLAAIESTLRGTITDWLESEVGAEWAAAALRFHANRHRLAPAHYRVLDLTEEQWSLLQGAIEAQNAGREPTNAQAVVLAQAQSSPLAATAAARLQNNLPAIEAAFDALLAQAEPIE